MSKANKTVDFINVIEMLVLIIIFVAVGFSFFGEPTEKRKFYKENETSIDESLLNDETKSDEPGRFYSNQLKGYGKYFYNQMMENKDNLKSGDYTIDFGYTFSDTIAKNDVSDENGILEHSGYLDVYEGFMLAKIVFLIENPDMYFIDYSKWDLFSEGYDKYYVDGAYHLYINGADESYYIDEITSRDEIESMEKEIEDIASEVIETANSLPDDYSKIKMVHDFLINNIEYDETKEAPHTHDLYGALVNKKCVCDGYSYAFQYFMMKLGIDSICIPGYIENIEQDENPYHQWNYVKLDDVWYAVDATWDDPIREKNVALSDKEKHRFFLIGSDEESPVEANREKIHVPSWRLYQPFYDHLDEYRESNNEESDDSNPNIMAHSWYAEREEKIRSGDIELYLIFPSLNKEKYSK